MHAGKVWFGSPFFVFKSKPYFIRRQASLKLYARLEKKLTTKVEIYKFTCEAMENLCARFEGEMRKKGETSRDLCVCKTMKNLYANLEEKKVEKRREKCKFVHLWNYGIFIRAFREKKKWKYRKKVEICTFVKQWGKKRKERVNLNAHLWNNGKKGKMKIYTHTSEAMEILYVRLE